MITAINFRGNMRIIEVTVFGVTVGFTPHLVGILADPDDRLGGWKFAS